MTGKQRKIMAVVKEGFAGAVKQVSENKLTRGVQSWDIYNININYIQTNKKVHITHRYNI